MFLATTNKAKRLVCLTYLGQVRAEEIKAGREETLTLLEDLGPGFRVLADFERLESMGPETAAEVGRLMEMADAKGVALIVRVVPDPSKDIGLNILAQFHYKRRVETVTCATMEEAARVLGI